jgi:hypothetical protein
MVVKYKVSVIEKSTILALCCELLLSLDRRALACFIVEVKEAIRKQQLTGNIANLYKKTQHNNLLLSVHRGAFDKA